MPWKIVCRNSLLKLKVINLEKLNYTVKLGNLKNRKIKVFSETDKILKKLNLLIISYKLSVINDQFFQNIDKNFITDKIH